jgi:hypothetical protein
MAMAVIAAVALQGCSSNTDIAPTGKDAAAYGAPKGAKNVYNKKANTSATGPMGTPPPASE